MKASLAFKYDDPITNRMNLSTAIYYNGRAKGHYRRKQYTTRGRLWDIAHERRIRSIPAERRLDVVDGAMNRILNEGMLRYERKFYGD